MMSEPTAPRYSALPGSERLSPPNATQVGPADPSARVRVSVYLRPRGSTPNTTQDATPPDSSGAEAAPIAEQPLSRQEFAARFGADPADIARVEQFAREHHLAVVETSIPRRVVVLEGTV